MIAGAQIQQDQAPAWLDERREAAQPAEAAPHIRLDGVEKRFGAFAAVDGVSLSIFRGELFSLLGGSGCGKTTLLRMLAGLETPSAGRILVDGSDMTDTPAYRRPTNMMFQSYALFPHMTVEANIAFGLRQDGVPRAEIARRVGEVLDLVQLAAFRRRKPHQLSGGQRQRVALARAVVKRPKVLLLDEPLSALDKKLRQETQFELMKIQRQIGITFVMVTHDQEEAMTMSSRIAVMRAGRIVQIGTPSEVYEYPQDRFVAEFIGSVNVFAGRLVGDYPDHAEVDSPDSGTRLLVGHGVTGAEGMALWVAVRPEKIALSKLGVKAGANRVEGVITEIAYLGDSSTYVVRLDGGKLVRVTAPNVARWAEQQFTWDERVVLSWSEASGVVLTQ